MKLTDLLKGIEAQIFADPNMEIDAVTYDSRKVTPGSMFVAITGFATDGNLYIPMAMQKGAPSKLVIAPTGRAEPLPMLRDRVSARSRRRLPMRQDTGSVTRWS